MANAGPGGLASRRIIADIWIMTWTDWAALALFFICWLGYSPILSLISRRGGSLNEDMVHVRAVWMQSMAHREIRLVDILDGSIYELPPQMREDNGRGRILFHHLPLKDSPLLLTFGDFL